MRTGAAFEEGPASSQSPARNAAKAREVSVLQANELKIKFLLASAFGSTFFTDLWYVITVQAFYFIAGLVNSTCTHCGPIFTTQF